MKSRYKNLIMMFFLMVSLTLIPAFAETAHAATSPIDVSTLQVTLSSGTDRVTAGEYIAVSFRIPNDTEVDHVNVFYIDEQSSTSNNRLIRMNRSEGGNGYWEGTLSITDDTPPGPWTISSIAVFKEDGSAVSVGNTKVNNGLTNTQDLSAGDFKVTGTHPDLSPPEIDASTLKVTPPPGNGTLTKGETATVSIKITDRKAEVKNASIFYLSGISGNYQEVQLKAKADDIWEGTFTTSEQTPAAVWQIQDIRVTDTSENNNYGSYCNAAYFNTSPSTWYPDLSAGNITVVDDCKVTFDTRGGSIIAPQYLTSGETADRPDDPTMEKPLPCEFIDWYTDESLTTVYDFDTPVDRNITLYAKWKFGVTACSYEQPDGISAAGGKYTLQSAGQQESEKRYDGEVQLIEEGTQLTLKAFPDARNSFVGWYEGELVGENDTELAQSCCPLDMDDPDTLLSTDPVCTVTIDRCMVICPVFEGVTQETFRDYLIEQHRREAIAATEAPENWYDPDGDITWIVEFPGGGEKLVMKKETDYTGQHDVLRLQYTKSFKSVQPTSVDHNVQIILPVGWDKAYPLEEGGDEIEPNQMYISFYGYENSRSIVSGELITDTETFYANIHEVSFDGPDFTINENTMFTGQGQAQSYIWRITSVFAMAAMDDWLLHKYLGQGFSYLGLPAMCEGHKYKAEIFEEHEAVYCDCGTVRSFERVNHHDWGEPTYTWANDNSSVTAKRVCRNEITHVDTETVKTTAKVVKPATYTEAGKTLYTATFTKEGFNTQEKTIANIPKLKRAQPMTVKARVITVKVKKLKKAAKVVSPVTVAHAAGAVSYKITGGKAKAKKVLKINKRNGKITVKKKTKKGTYKVKVAVSAAGNVDFHPGSKAIWVTVKVK